jgi:hypothetical protein
MSHGSLILRYKLIVLRRWLRTHLFTLFVLGPMILFGFYFVLEPSLMSAAAWVRQKSLAWTAQDLQALALGLAIVLAAMSLSSTLRAVYSLSSADAYLDALPVRPASRFHVLALSQILRKAPVLVVLLVTFKLLGGVISPWIASKLVVALAELALAEILAVLLLVHYRSFRAARLLVLAGLLGAVILLSRSQPSALLVLLPLLPPAALLGKTLAAALSVGDPSAGLLSAEWIHGIAIVALYGLSGLAYVPWRDAGREYARESASRRRRRAIQRFASISRRFGTALVAQVLRDWRLTRRVFSPAVYVAAGFAALFLLLPGFVLARWNLDPEWFAKGVLICCAFSVLSLAALAPLLLRYELPHFWVEQAAGVDPQTIWRAKVWYACLLTAPVIPLGVLIAALQSPLGLVEAMLFVAKLALMSVTVASLIGAVAFESLDSPVLGLLLSGLFAMGMAGMYIFTDAWPVTAFIHVYLMHHLYERADGHSDALGAEL